MRCVRRVCVAVFAAAAFLVCCVGVASGPAWADDDDDPRLMLFSGRDLWRNGAFVNGGLLIAPGGFEQDGFMLKLLMSSGLYRYDSDALGGERVIGAEVTTQVLPGFRIKRGGVEAKFFLGLDFEEHRLWPDDPSNKLTGSAIGMRAAAEFWYEPTPSTVTMGNVSLSTIATNNSARLAYGWRVFEGLLQGFYVGPEIQYFGSDGYRHLRFGGHITGLKTDAYQWSAAVGFAQDSENRSSLYVRLELNIK